MDIQRYINARYTELVGDSLEREENRRRANNLAAKLEEKGIDIPSDFEVMEKGVKNRMGSYRDFF